MPTVKDVARLARVSTATVSAAINGTAYVSPLLKARVDQAVEELGYATDGIARSLKKGTSNLIGLIVDDITSPFYAELVEQIEALAYKQQYAVLLCHTARDAEKERRYLDLLRTRRVDGIVWAPTGGGDDYKSATDFKRFKVPLVFIDRILPAFEPFDSVVLNNRSASVQATNYLLDLGHRNIAMMSGPDFLDTGAQRTQGFRDAMASRGHPVRNELVRNGNFRQSDAFEECRRLLAKGHPFSAILVANYPMLIGVMQALSSVGLAYPDDISVISIDDFPLAGALRPGFTTVRQPIAEMARAALDLLLRRLNSHPPHEPAHLLFEPTLIVRGSCLPYSSKTLRPSKARTPVIQ